MLIDRFGRPLDSLRISVTDRCNYRCIYCHAEGVFTPSLRELSADDIGFIAGVARRLGVTRFKLTGGEPLIRRDIVSIVSRLSALKPVDLGATTNGYFLRELAEPLAEAGLMRVNVNLPSTRRSVYAYITGVDALPRVVEGMRRAADAGLRLKINFVLLRSLNSDELPRLVELAAELGADINLIELEPIAITWDFFNRFFEPAEEALRRLGPDIVGVSARTDLHTRPVYVLSNGVRIEVISWLNQASFCLRCTRVRLTSDGVLRYCIADPQGVDLKPCLEKRDEGCVEEGFRRVNALRRPFWLYAGKSLPPLSSD